REIHLSGSWAVLRDNQQLYFEKPPLYPWLAALFSLPAGRPTEAALRLPSSLSALFGLVVVFYLGRSLFGRRTGTLAAVILAAAYRSTGESFPLEALLQRLAHRFTSGEHHAQPFYHVLISLPLEFFPWVILLPAALRQTFPRPGARPDKDNAYVYSWVVVIFTVFAVSVEKRGVYLLPLLPLLALLVARLWDLALMDWDPSPADRPIAWLLGISLALAIGGALLVLPKIRIQAPDLVRPGA